MVRRSTFVFWICCSVACVDVPLFYQAADSKNLMENGPGHTEGDTGDTGDTGETEDGTLGAWPGEWKSQFLEIPPATEQVYLHTAEELYSWNLRQSQAQAIGQTRTAKGKPVRFSDIAVDVWGRMFGVSGGYLYGIDPETAQAWTIGPLPFQGAGLGALPDGRLALAGDGILLINPETGANTTLVPEGSYGTAGDVVVLPDGQLYWTIRPDPAVVRVDPETGEMSVLSHINRHNVSGLAYTDDVLYGFSSSGEIVILDPDSGTITSESELSGPWFGAAGQISL